MSIEDYKRAVKPSKRRSKLDPYKTEIFSLARDGYSTKQIADWLWREQQIRITGQSVWEFMQRRQKADAALPALAKSEKVTAPGPAAPASEEATPAPQVQAPTVADALDPEKRKQRAESYITGSSTLSIGRKNK